MPYLTYRSAGNLMAVAFALAAVALLCLTIGIGSAAAQSKYEPPRGATASQKVVKPLGASEMAVLQRYVKSLRGGPSRPGPGQSRPGNVAALPGTADDSFCCWKNSQGQWQCHPVDLLTICINSIKVTCGANGCSVD